MQTNGAVPNGHERGEPQPVQGRNVTDEEFAYWRGQVETKLERVDLVERKLDKLDEKVDALKLRVAAIVGTTGALLAILEVVLRFAVK